MNPDHVAQAAQLAMLIELSSSPKPGNVDRCHDFGEMGFQHFLVSAVSAYPTFRKAASNEASLGELILEAVSVWNDWNLQENTHFGSIALLIPLAVAAGRSKNLKENLCQVLEDSTVEDAVNFYAAFDLARARVTEVKDLSLTDSSSIHELRKQGKNLLDLMKLSQDHDMVAREWATNFDRSFRLAEILEKNISKQGLNNGVVLTYLEALAEEPDSLVRSKFGPEIAKQVSRRAGAAFRSDLKETLYRAEELDQAFIREDINPGSTADLIASALFIDLVKGKVLWRKK
ncbi:MAG: triphosphoribosyl-dephospho-CoA synthase [Methanotrichaceae archaeon]